MSGVEPVFGGDRGRDQAIDYAKNAPGIPVGAEIRVFDAVGAIVERIAAT
jgi:hypothetical protein